MENKRYLGDGVYARFDGYHIVLYTLEGAEIFLEGAVIAELEKYTEDVKKGYIKP